mgnify:CR=1 FL=1
MLNNSLKTIVELRSGIFPLLNNVLDIVDHGDTHYTSGSEVQLHSKIRMDLTSGDFHSPLPSVKIDS